MTRDPELAVVVSARPWAERLHRFTVDHGGARVRLRPLRADDLAAEEYDVLVIDDITSFLSQRLVAEVHSAGRAVFGVFDATSGDGGRVRLLDLGADEVIDCSAATEEFIGVIGRLAVARRHATTSGVRVPSNKPGVEDPGLIAVLAGPSGGVGHSEIAVTLAQVLHDRAGGTVLVDADDVNPSIAQRLGVPPHPNIRSAVDAHHHRSGGVLASLTATAHGGFEVLAGLNRPSDWSDVHPSDLSAVIEQLAAERECVVVDVSSRIEDLTSAAGEPRYRMGRALLRKADVVVAVCEATPIGVARLLGWLVDAPITETAVHVVLNKAPRSPFKQGEAVAEVARTFTADSFHLVPFDEDLADMVWAGEISRSGPFRRAVESVADSAFPAVVARRHRRQRERAIS